VRYRVLMLAPAGLLAAALVAGPTVAAHELDSEQPLTREQIERVKELAKDLPANTVLKIDQKNPSNTKSAFVKDRLAPGQPLAKGIKFETLAKNAEFVTGIAHDSGRAPKEGDDMSSTASWGFYPRGGFSGGFVRGPYGGSAGFIRGPNGGSIGWARRGWGGGWGGGGWGGGGGGGGWGGGGWAGGGRGGGWGGGGWGGWGNRWNAGWNSGCGSGWGGGCGCSGWGNGCGGWSSPSYVYGGYVVPQFPYWQSSWGGWNAAYCGGAWY
jgi:hypothetical protein